MSYRRCVFSIFVYGLLSLPLLARAETYLCVAEAGAAVGSGGNEHIKATLADVSHSRYVMSNEGGQFSVKAIGSNTPLFDRCVSEFFCDQSQWYAGVFMRQNDGGFSITFMNQVGDREYLIVEKGRCTKL